MADYTRVTEHISAAESLMKEGERLLGAMPKTQRPEQMQADLLSIIAVSSLAQNHIGLAEHYRST